MAEISLSRPLSLQYSQHATSWRNSKALRSDYQQNGLAERDVERDQVIDLRYDSRLHSGPLSNPS